MKLNTYFIKRMLLVVLSICAHLKVFAQYASNNTPSIGDVVTYTCNTNFVNDAGGSALPQHPLGWSVQNGIITNTTSTNGIQTTTVKWTQTGTGYVQYIDGQGNWGQMPISVKLCGGVTNPSFVLQESCATNTTLITATPGTNATTVRWYANAVDVNHFYEGTSYTTPVLTSSVTYYISSYSSSSGCYSSRIPVQVGIPILAPSLRNLGIDQNGQYKLRATLNNNQTSTPADQAKWYDQPTGGTVLFQGLDYTTPVITTDKTYYVAAVRTSTTCESQRASITIRPVSAYMPSIKTQTIRIKDVKTVAEITPLTEAQKNTVITHLDGFLRPVQQVAVMSSPTGYDVIQPIEYDQYGRAPVSYMPYVGTGTSGALEVNYKVSQAAFYNTPSNKVADDAAPKAVTVYDNSPFSRVKEQGSVGTAWQPGAGHTTQFTLTFNAANEVRNFLTDGTSTAFYAANTLVKSIVKDPQGNNIISYRKSNGLVVLEKQQLDKTINGTLVDYLETYYVYDDMDRLKYIISPKGVAALKAGSWSLTAGLLDQYVHQFVYDYRGRMIEKKVPGQAWVYIGYDRLNRIVLVQDGLLRAQNKWMFVKYDGKNRGVMMGTYTNTTHTTRAAIQQNVLDPLYANAADKYFEERGTTLHGYTNQSFPTTNTEVWVVNYSDNYDFDYNGTEDFTYTAQGLANEGTQGTSYGMPTGGKRLILGTTTWLYTYVFYDKYGRAIQVRSNNHLNPTMDNLFTTVYDFEGKSTLSKNFHKTATSQVTVINKYEYDTKSRPTKIYQNINSAPSDQLVAQYEYNELGQVVDKKLHNTTGTNFLQSVDYRYTIQGWLSSINNSQLNVNAANNDDTNDLFGMEFLYNNTETGLNNTGYFNGNISAVKWKGPGVAAGAVDQRSYKYTYDKTNKLETATWQANTGSAWTKEASAYNESMTYDHNGNILTLQRNQRKHQMTGTTPSYGFEQIDNLTYTYNATIGDRIDKVEDATGRKEGFTNGVTASTEYTYDVNGNLTADQNKGISSIVYNLLGKASQINFTDGRRVDYTYDASGAKLTMKTYQGSTLNSTLDYVGNFVYENSVLSFFSSPEGRVVHKNNTFEYQYALADHQGNTRVVFTSATPTPDVTIATFEGNSEDQASSFQHVNTSEIYNYPNANQTAGGGYVIRMNQNYDSNPGFKLGPSKSLNVYPGDKVDLEVYAYHINGSGYGSTSSTVANVVALVAGGFGGVSGGTGESGLIYNGVNTAFGAFGYAGNRGDNKPAAYLNYILFDQNYKVLDMGWKPAPDAAFTKQKLSFNTLNIKEPGILFVYLSYDNESNNYVYFDDLKITHTPTNVIQYNEYYPFGLQASTSWTRVSNTNNYLYNSGSELNTTSGWYETFFRGYDPALGRFLQVDPMATKFANISGYNYAFNNPVMLNDPMGDRPVIISGNDDQLVWLMPDGNLVNTSNFYAFNEMMSEALGDLNDFMSTGSMGPGSGMHWSDAFRSVSGNFALMDRSTFQNFYGVDLNSDEGKWATATAVSRKPSENDLVKVAGLLGMSVMDIGKDAAYLIKVLNPAAMDSHGNHLSLQLNGVISISLGVSTEDLLFATDKLPIIDNEISNTLGLGISIVGGTMSWGAAEAAQAGRYLDSAVKGFKVAGNTVAIGGFALTTYSVGAKVINGTLNTSDLLDFGVSGGLLTAGLFMTNPVGLGILAIGGIGYGIYRIGWGEKSDKWINDKIGFDKIGFR